MTRRKFSERNVRTLTKMGHTSLGLTLPIDILEALGWKEKQKVSVTMKSDKIIVENWNESRQI